MILIVPYFLTKLNKTVDSTDEDHDVDFNTPSPVSKWWKYIRRQGDPISNHINYFILPVTFDLSNKYKYIVIYILIFLMILQSCWIIATF